LHNFTPNPESDSGPSKLKGSRLDTFALGDVHINFAFFTPEILAKTCSQTVSHMLLTPGEYKQKTIPPFGKLLLVLSQSYHSADTTKFPDISPTIRSTPN